MVIFVKICDKELFLCDDLSFLCDHTLFIFDDKRRRAHLEQNIEQLTEIFKEWKEESPSIAVYFKERNRKKAKEPMIYFFHQFLLALYSGNGKTANEQYMIDWKRNVKELPQLPVNAIERLSFIEEQPDHYQSYIQLSELFSEWEKKSVILLRRKT